MSVTGIAPLRVLYCEGCSSPLLGCVHKEVVDDNTIGLYNYVVPIVILHGIFAPSVIVILGQDVC